MIFLCDEVNCEFFCSNIENMKKHQENMHVTKEQLVK